MMVDPSVQWRRSSYSNGMGGECVEVGVSSTAVAVRDSKDPLGSHIATSTRAWQIFVAAMRATAID
ncbi:DUF397 domain-containing protein [Streptomyces sp. NPDC046465]|uniref:DUF397 domain-containing protein n=1 Tax=Streptomyces sp. NPDC046465 TaxID=3155810 RepID=UPI0033C1CF64